MQVVLHSLFLTFICIYYFYISFTNGLGCVATLARGHSKHTKGDYKSWYESTLIKRNKAIERHLYSKRSEPIDIVIFQEGDISKEHQLHIQKATPKMNITFIDVREAFRKRQYDVNPICPPSQLSQTFRYGYKAMCQFWFAKFAAYTKNYDWLLRIDSDNILLSNVNNVLKSIHGKANIATSIWRNGTNLSPDMITARREGVVVLGMRNFTKNFALSHKISGNFNNWKMPYTNIFYLDLQWYRSSKIISDYTNAVVQSRCIFSNRWGDMPLWGALAALMKQPPIIINIPYYHGSHHAKIKPAI